MARRSKLEAGLALGEIARLTGGELHGRTERVVHGVAEIEDATAHDLVFCADRRRAGMIDRDCPAAVIAAPGLDVAGELDVIRVAAPHLAVARVLEALYPAERLPAGVHPSAVVDPSAELGEEVCVGALAVVGAGAVIGAGTQIGPRSIVGLGVHLGRDCLIHGGVTIYDATTVGDRVILHAGSVIGADGFGYARDGAVQVKVPQVGGVILGDDVEIGANACVDRGTLAPTVIGEGTKIDNLVQVGHNCRVGRHCAISGLSGLSGSTVLEDGVILGGNVGTAGHQVIGRGTMVAAKSGVHGDVAPGSIIGGAPQLDMQIFRRVVGALPKLPELLRRVRRLERLLEDTPASSSKE